MFDFNEISELPTSGKSGGQENPKKRFRSRNEHSCIIFLDVDSTINYVKQSKEDTICNPERDYQVLAKSCLDLLVKLAAETNAGIVITSQWRLHNESLMWLLRTLNSKGLTLLGETDNLEGEKPYGRTRADEIKLWLLENNQEDKPFVILDDDITACSEALKPFFIHSNYNTGITEQDCKLAKLILGR